MAYSKKDEFSQVDVQISGFAKSMAHPARIAILKLLADRKSSTCGEIVDALPLSQASVSRHLDELKIAGLVSGKQNGPQTVYTVNQENCKKAMDFFGAVFRTSVVTPAISGIETNMNRPAIADVLMSGHVYRQETYAHKNRW